MGKEGTEDGVEHLLHGGELAADDEHAADDPQGGDSGYVGEGIVEGLVEEIHALTEAPLAELGGEEGTEVPTQSLPCR